MPEDVHVPQSGHSGAHPRLRTRAGWRFPARVIGLAGLLTSAALVLLYEHGAHVLGLFPWVLVLLCPLLHLFGHGGNGGHGAGHRHAASDAAPTPQDAAEIRVAPRWTP